MKYFLKALTEYSNFSDRTRRKEFWMYTLFRILFELLFCMIAVYTRTWAIYAIAHVFILLPSISISVRRMHDTGRSGWFIFVPIMNIIYPFIDSQKGENKYGPNPKGL
ncbi:DUF805 domain-containing protein [Flammeovirga pacifica]|uniref:DUF805 domain-containing protein n=1 Tax=Flammeovirga pacifica TaxID=915059 RepID=A0A1S1Z1E5_FLAPC|nr:DUF805 domain-containing protein [Flammeovirga pacifica]OHX67094.1 hypothetical protein NH26_12445 [Flammeovirga pacifica]